MSNEKDSVRLIIVQYALSQVGAHYLNGSDGGFPGTADGLKKRKIELLEEGSWDGLAVHAAKWSSLTCTGRYGNVGGSYFKPNTKTLDELKTWCEEQRAETSAADWPDFRGGLYPRRLKGKGSTIYLGEDCRQRRHFDCISFVNWVLTTALQKSYSYSIVQYEGRRDGSGVVAPVTVHDKPFPTPRNGDIVTRINWEKKTDEEDEVEWEIGSKHIGILTATGKVIEAKGSAHGVVISNFNSSKWTALCRLKDAWLKFGT